MTEQGEALQIGDSPLSSCTKNEKRSILRHMIRFIQLWLHCRRLRPYRADYRRSLDFAVLKANEEACEYANAT